MIFMMITPVWYFILGIVLILIPMLGGFYLLHKRQSEVLQVGQEQGQKLDSIGEQTSLLPSIDRQFMTPQYLAQFTVTLKNKNKDVLRLGDIVYIKVKMKTIHLYTIQQEEYKMDANLREVVEGSNPILPPTLFVRINKSEIVNVLYIKNALAEEVKVTGINGSLKTLSLTSMYKEKALEIFSLRDL